MATSKCYYPRPSHRFFTTDQHVTATSDFELDEWDLFNTGSDSSSSFSFSDLTITSGRTGTNRQIHGGSDSGKAASSLPVNVPDWSKILGDESRRQRKISNEEEVDGDEILCGEGTRRVPPHELLANRRMASFSAQIFSENKTKEDSSIFDAKLLNQHSHHIPQQFVWPDHEKPSTDVQPLQVPLIDLAGFLSGDSCLASEATRLVSKAATKHGFFLITNHGVDESLLSRAYLHMDSFFKAPACEKQKAQRKWGESSGYASSFVGRFSSKLPWKETLSFKFSPEEKIHSQTVKDFVSKKMGDGYEDFGKVYQEYAEAMNTLSLKIMELLGMSLGVERRYFKEFFEDSDSIFRLNYYPQCKQPELALGTGPHCDPTSLTILHQDQVGGLQVFVDNKWQSIPPNPHAFVVNIGDTFMALTNGRYKSCLHRAVVNSERERKTFAFFLCPKGEKVVKPPEELVNGVKSGERKYPDFTWSMFLEFTQKHYRADMNTLDEFSIWLKNRRSF